MSEIDKKTVLAEAGWEKQPFGWWVRGGQRLKTDDAYVAETGAARKLKLSEERKMEPLAHAGQTHYNTAYGQMPSQAERPNVAEGEASPRMGPGELRDDLYLSPEDREAYGIPNSIPASLAGLRYAHDHPRAGELIYEGDRVYRAMRAPAVYGKSEPGHMRRVKMKWKSFQAVTDGDGNPVYATDDTIYYTVSREEYMAREIDRPNQAAAEFTQAFFSGKGIGRTPEEATSVESFRANDPAYVEKKYRESHEKLSGMKTKWPANLTIEQIEAGEGADKTLNLERKWARNGRSERPGEYAKYEEMMAARSGKKTKEKSFSFPGAPTA